MKKYEFTGETKTVALAGRTATLHRIRAIVCFKGVNSGDTGGWVECEKTFRMKVMPGSMVMPRSMITPRSVVMPGSMAMPGSVITPRSVIMPRSVVMPGSMAMQGSMVMPRSFRQTIY